MKQPPEPPDLALINLQGQEKYIILHDSDSVWHFTGIVIENAVIKGTIYPLIGHDTYLKTDSLRANRYKKSKNEALDESGVVNEVHVYVDGSLQPSDTTVAFQISDIGKIEIFEHDKGATTGSWVFGSLLGVVAATGITIGLILLLKESCPFIYIHDGSSFNFIGEIYSGSIYPSLERHDYLRLPAAKPGQKNYTVKMTNEVREIQHTNLIEVDVFDHPAGVKVIEDKYGKYHTLSNIQDPVEATNLRGLNVLSSLKKADTLYYLGEELGKDAPLTGGVILKYPLPHDATHAKLLVRAKNSFWADYIIMRFHSLFGSEYNCWVEKQEKVPPDRIRKWMLDQNIPLSLYVEKDGKWKFVDYYNIAGPMALKEDILAFDIPTGTSGDIRIKLESGYLFWEIDYAGIDFSRNIQLNKRTAVMETAIDEKGNYVRELLLADDNLYYDQPEIGNEVTMNFILPETTNAEQTIILHSKGYYKIILDSQGDQQKNYLLSFRKKGRLSEFSSDLLRKHSGYPSH